MTLINKLLLVLGLTVGMIANAEAAKTPPIPPQVVAYWEKPGNPNVWIVLTNVWRKEDCPPHSYAALQRMENGEAQDGCWISSQTDVMIFWKPDNRAVNYGWSQFNIMYRLNGVPDPCYNPLTFYWRGL